MPILPRPSDVGLLLSRCRTVGTGDVAFLLGLGAHLVRFLTLRTLRSSLKGDAAEDDLINIIAAKLIIHRRSGFNDGTTSLL